MRTARVVAAVLLCAGVARADGPTSVLVLPTQVAGSVPDRARLQRDLDQRLERAVDKSGRALVPRGPLTSGEAACRDADCMGKVADGAGVQIVIGARVTADKGSPPSYKLVLDRYDRERPGAVRREDAECSVCTEKETADRVEQVATTLLPMPSAEPVAVAPQVVTTQPVVVAKPSKARLYAAVGISSALTVGGLVMLGLSSKAFQLDGHSVGGFPSKDVYDTRGTGIGLVTAGVIVTVGGIVGLTVSAIKLRRAH